MSYFTLKMCKMPERSVTLLSFKKIKGIGDQASNNQYNKLKTVMCFTTTTTQPQLWEPVRQHSSRDVNL